MKNGVDQLLDDKKIDIAKKDSHAALDGSPEPGSPVGVLEGNLIPLSEEEYKWWTMDYLSILNFRLPLILAPFNFRPFNFRPPPLENNVYQRCQHTL